MIMQISAPSSYMSSISGSSSYTAMPSADLTAIVPTMRRVISSPSKHTMQLRDAAKSQLAPSSRSLSHQAMTINESDRATEELLPAFLRDEYFTKQAIKQMAEHRVLLDARKKTSQLDVDDDEYAWYFNNPHRYVWRPRDRRAGKIRTCVVLHGELGQGCDVEKNKSLFASYLIRHYGSTSPSVESGQKEDTHIPHARDTSAALDSYRTPAGWGVDMDESEASTVFWLDEGDDKSVATTANASVQQVKHSKVSSADDITSSPLSVLSDYSTPSAVYPASGTKRKGKRWSCASTTSDAMDSSTSRRSVTRTRTGSQRRFSIFRLFSTT